MAKNIFLLSVIGTLILTGVGWAKLKLESYTGDVYSKDHDHPCPTLQVRFEQHPVPFSVRTCGCSEQAIDTDPRTAVHPPKALVDVARNGDRIGLRLHEYAPILGGDAVIAITWVLAGKSVGEKSYVVSPAGPLYRNIILRGVAPLVLGTLLAIVIALLYRRKSEV